MMSKRNSRAFSAPLDWPETESEPHCAPGESEYDAEERDDLQLAQVLLTGFHERTGPGGLPQKKYLKPGDELVGRKALARLLRSNKPVDQTILLRLAALFDPETETAPFSSFDCEPVERRLTFASRHKGRKTTAPMGRLELALAFKALWATKGRAPKARDDALNEIVDQFGLTTRSVETAWSYYRSVVGR